EDRFKPIPIQESLTKNFTLKELQNAYSLLMAASWSHPHSTSLPSAPATEDPEMLLKQIQQGIHREKIAAFIQSYDFDSTLFPEEEQQSILEIARHVFHSPEQN